MMANFYLFDFDEALTAGGFSLIRYADDFVVMCESRDEAQRALDLSRRTLSLIGLEIHPLGSGKTNIGDLHTDGLSFLGLHFHQGRIVPAEKSKERLKKKLERR
jgi:RNA-directed DNA polymerase